MSRIKQHRVFRSCGAPKRTNTRVAWKQNRFGVETNFEILIWLDVMEKVDFIWSYFGVNLESVWRFLGCISTLKGSLLNFFLRVRRQRQTTAHHLHHG